MTMPALALVGASGRIQKSTDLFHARCERAAELLEQVPELGAVLSGEIDQAVVSLDGAQAQVEATVDAGGSRCALLTVAGSAGEGENPIFRENLDDSPAIVWLKDLDGRHMRVNRMFVSVLNSPEDQVQGRTDEELAPGATIDGPRLQDSERSATEPVEFEYTVPAYQDRPALAAVRFLVQGADGEPVAICGVASPMSHAEIADAEAARLMQLNGWSQLESGSIREELLEEWGVQLGASSSHEHAELGPEPIAAPLTDASGWAIVPEPAGDPEPGDLGPHQPDGHPELDLAAVAAARDDAISARDEARAQREEAIAARAALEEQVRALEEQLAQASRGADPSMQPLDGDAAHAIETARSETEAARAQADAARSVAMTARSEADAARSAVETARAEAEAARAQLEAAQSEIASARAEADAARTQEAAARTEAASAWAEAETERTNAGILAGQLADARRQLQHQRAQVALAQQQLQIPRCSAAAQASRAANQHGHRGENGVIKLRARKPAAQPLDPTVMSQPAPASATAASPHEHPQQGGLLGKLRPRRQH